MECAAGPFASMAVKPGARQSAGGALAGIIANVPR